MMYGKGGMLEERSRGREVAGPLILEPESTDNYSPARLLEAVFFVFM